MKSTKGKFLVIVFGVEELGVGNLQVVVCLWLGNIALRLGVLLKGHLP